MQSFRRIFDDPSDPDIWIADENPESEKYVLVTVTNRAQH
jgi:hypothetical protein